MTSKIIIVVGLCLFLLSACTKKEEDRVFATVNGQEIKGRDFLPIIRPQLNQLKREEVEMKKRALEQVIQKTLVEQEAKKGGVAAEKLFAPPMNGTPAQVSKQEISEFLKSRGINEKRLTKQDKATLPGLIEAQKITASRRQAIASLRNKAQIKFEDPQYATAPGSP